MTGKGLIIFWFRNDMTITLSSEREFIIVSCCELAATESARKNKMSLIVFITPIILVVLTKRKKASARNGNAVNASA